MHEFLKFFTDYLFLMNSIFIIIIIFLERKKPVYTMFWILLLVSAPYLGFFTYLFFGLSFRKSRIIKKFYGRTSLFSDSKIDLHHVEHLFKWRNLVEYLEVSQAGVLSSYDDVQLFTTGHDFFSNLTTDIEKAKKTIHMEYFVFKDDKLGQALFDAIIKKSQEGVSIKLILDGANSVTMRKIRKFKKAGIEVELFFPSFFHFLKLVNIRANYRDHKKITIIDNSIGYLGGFNIGNEYIGKGELGKWRDTAVKFTGNCVHELEKEFAHSWNFIKKNCKESDNCLYPDLHNQHKKNINFAQLVSSGPNFQFRTARDNFLKMILEAKKSIYIETPYFIPDEHIMEALKISAISGVKIKIIIPDKPDHYFVYWVNQAFAWELLEVGVKFYRYSEGFIHSKMIIIDDEIATLGTTNMDYRSFYSNFEVNINFYGGDIINKLIKSFIVDIRNSTPLTIQDFGKRSYVVKFKESIFRLLAPML